MGTLGMIAGDGQLPHALAGAAERDGRPLVAVGFREITEPSLEGCVSALEWVRLGEVQRLLDTLHAADVREVVMAGKVPKALLYGRPGVLQLDERALRLLSSLGDRSDDSILHLLARELEAEGIRLLPQAQLAPELLVAEGPMGQIRASSAQMEDVAYAWPIARALGGVDVGQTVVVKQGAVLALEAIEGTDAAILRGGRLGGEGACVVKLVKPDQDPRFDVPVIGPQTLECMREVGARLLACEAGRTLVVERQALVERADAAGIALLGVGSAGPGGGLA